MIENPIQTPFLLNLLLVRIPDEHIVKLARNLDTALWGYLSQTKEHQKWLYYQPEQESSFYNYQKRRTQQRSPVNSSGLCGQSKFDFPDVNDCNAELRK